MCCKSVNDVLVRTPGFGILDEITNHTDDLPVYDSSETSPSLCKLTDLMIRSLNSTGGPQHAHGNLQIDHT